MKVIVVEEPFHGCAETLQFFAKLITAKAAVQNHVFVSFEMMNAEMAAEMNKTRTKTREIRGLMLTQFLAIISKKVASKLVYVGLDVGYNTNQYKQKINRDQAIAENLAQNKTFRGTVYYYGFHILPSLRGKTYINDHFLKKNPHVKIQGIVSIAPSMRTLLADTSGKSTDFETEVKVRKMADINKYVPPTSFEEQFVAYKSPKLLAMKDAWIGESYRYAGIWFRYRKEGRVQKSHYTTLSNLTSAILVIPRATLHKDFL